MTAVILQDPTIFRNTTEIAEKNNYLFRLFDLMVERRMAELDSEGAARCFALGVRTYQALTAFADPGQPNFTMPPDTTAALQVVGRFGAQRGYEIIDNYATRIESMSQEAPLLTDVSIEVIEKYTSTKGDLRIDLAGAAAICTAQVEAEELLVS